MGGVETNWNTNNNYNDNNSIGVEDEESSLDLEVRVLTLLLKRNAAAHGRTPYFRRCRMVLSALFQYPNLPPHQILDRIDYAAKALFTETSRGYFLPLCTLALACLARIRHCLSNNNNTIEEIKDSDFHRFLEQKKSQHILSHVPPHLLQLPTNKNINDTHKQQKQQQQNDENESDEFQTTMEEDRNNNNNNSNEDCDIGQTVITADTMNENIQLSQKTTKKIPVMDNNMKILMQLDKQQKNDKKRKNQTQSDSNSDKSKKKRFKLKNDTNNNDSTSKDSALSFLDEFSDDNVEQQQKIKKSKKKKKKKERKKSKTKDGNVIDDIFDSLF